MNRHREELQPLEFDDVSDMSATPGLPRPRRVARYTKEYIGKGKAIKFIPVRFTLWGNDTIDKESLIAFGKELRIACSLEDIEESADTSSTNSGNLIITEERPTNCDYTYIVKIAVEDDPDDPLPAGVGLFFSLDPSIRGSREGAPPIKHRYEFEGMRSVSVTVECSAGQVTATLTRAGDPKIASHNNPAHLATGDIPIQARPPSPLLEIWGNKLTNQYAISGDCTVGSGQGIHKVPFHKHVAGDENDHQSR